MGFVRVVMRSWKRNNRPKRAECRAIELRRTCSEFVLLNSFSICSGCACDGMIEKGIKQEKMLLDNGQMMIFLNASQGRLGFPK